MRKLTRWMTVWPYCNDLVNIVGLSMRKSLTLQWPDIDSYELPDDGPSEWSNWPSVSVPGESSNFADQLSTNFADQLWPIGWPYAMVSLNGQNACLDRQIDHQNDWEWLSCTKKWSDLTFLWVVRFTLFGKTGPFYDLMDLLGGLMDPLELWAVQCILLSAIRPSWLNYTEWPDGRTELPYEWQHVYWPFEWPDWPSESWFILWVTKFTGLNSW